MPQILSVRELCVRPSVVPRTLQFEHCACDETLQFSRFVRWNRYRGLEGMEGSKVDPVWCVFTLIPSPGIRLDCLLQYSQFARPLGMEELRQGLITCVIHRVWFPSLILVTFVTNHIFQFRFVHTAQYCHSIWLFTHFYFAVDVHVVRWSSGNALVGEFMVTFLLVFTGLEPAANSDIPIFRRWHALQ